MNKKSINDIIKARSSIRTYLPERLSNDDKKIINEFIDKKINKQFKPDLRFEIIDIDDETLENTKKLSSYGIIKGAKTFIASIMKKNASILDLGYAFEQILLFATENNIGTCWLGGTFSRSSFADAVGLKSDEILPTISPLGYEAKKPSKISLAMRYFAKSDKRIPFEKLFFDKKTLEPLIRKKAGQYAEVLDMLRIAPSASNKQPWRVMMENNKEFDFYIEKTKNYSGNGLSYDIQMIDMGIAMCHFDLTAKEKAIKGKFSDMRKENIKLDNQRKLEYITTFIKGN